MKISIEKAVSLISSEDNFVILSHKSPDGDTLGSATALYYMLIGMGKKAIIRCNDPFPSKYDYLFEGYTEQENDEHFIISVDIADEVLFGSKLESYLGRVDLSIDHHKSSRLFAKYNLLDEHAGATCQLLYFLLKEFPQPIGKRVADCLYTGIITDTGCFRYPNTSRQTHLVAADLLDAGANAVGITKTMFESKTKGRIFVEKHVLNSMEFFYDQRVVVIDLPLDLVEQSGADEGELDGISAIPKTIIGVDVAVTFREKAKNLYKISLRTTEKVDGSVVCAEFGGGGHARAAGCTITGDYQTAKTQILQILKKYL